MVKTKPPAPAGSAADGTHAHVLVGLVHGEDDVQEAQPGDGAARVGADHEEAKHRIGLEEIVRVPEARPRHEGEEDSHHQRDDHRQGDGQELVQSPYPWTIARRSRTFVATSRKFASWPYRSL